MKFAVFTEMTVNISAFVSRNEFHANLMKTEITEVSKSTKIRCNQMQLKTYIPQNNENINYYFI